MSLTGLDLTATVDANVTGYDRGIEQAIAATRRYEASLMQLEADILKVEKSLDDHATAALKRQHDAMDKTGKAMLVFGGAAAVGFGMAVNEAIKWQYAWAGVTKTTNGTAAQMSTLEGQLRDLTKVLPASHEEIAAVAEAAGQLGVRRDDIAAFTKVMINLGQATNLSSDEAATAIAQFMNVMQSASGEVDHIGNTLVALGNKGASTEADIMHMAQRVVGAGHLIGLTSDQVLGLSAAMANLGIQSQLGGGAMQRIMLILYETVKSGGGALEDLAKFSGMSADRFAQTWQNKPIKALEAFVAGMNRTKDSGGNLVEELDNLGIKGTQNLQVLLRLAGSGNMLSKSVDQASSAWAKNTALIKEVTKRYETASGQIGLARNEIVNSAIDIGNLLLPAVAKLVTTGRDLVSFWSDLPGPLKGTVAMLGLLLTAFTLAGGAALIAIPKIAAFKTALNELEDGALKTAGTKLSGMAGILAGPWGLALGAGITALGYFAAKQEEAKRQVQELADTLDQQTGAITDNTRVMVIKSLSDQGLLESAKSLGLNLGMVTEAALGNQDALGKVNAALAQYRDDVQAMGTAHGGATGTLTQQAVASRNLSSALNDSNSKLQQATAQTKLKAEADRESGGSARAVKSAQDGLTQSYQDGAQAAGDMTQAVETLGQELHDASSDYLDNRDAARQIRDELRSITEAMNQFRKDHKGSLVGAFKEGTKSGDDFATMLDQLSQELQTHIDTTEKVTGSEKAVQKVYNESRARLLAVAQQIGMTKQAAEDYVTQVLNVPAIVQSHFQQDGMPSAWANAQKYNELLRNMPKEVVTHFAAIHDPTIGGGGRPGGTTGEVPGGRPRGGTQVGSSPRPAPRWYQGSPSAGRHPLAVAPSSGGRGATHVSSSSSHVIERMADRVTLNVDGKQFDAHVAGISRRVSRQSAQDVWNANQERGRRLDGG